MAPPGPGGGKTAPMHSMANVRVRPRFADRLRQRIWAMRALAWLHLTRRV